MTKEEKRGVASFLSSASQAILVLCMITAFPVISAMKDGNFGPIIAWGSVIVISFVVGMCGEVYKETNK